MDSDNKLLIVLLVAVSGLSLWIYFDSFAYAEGQIEEEIEGFIKEGTGEMVDRLTDDIDFGKENFLNTNEQETKALTDAGKNVFSDLVDLMFSSKDMAKAGIEFLSPFEMNVILVTVISIVIAIFFAVSMIKAIGKHIIIMVIIGLILVGIFVWFRINS